MKSTELRRAGPGEEPTGEAAPSLERTQVMMSRTHARQRSRRVSSTAMASVNRSNDETVPEPELDPEPRPIVKETEGTWGSVDEEEVVEGEQEEM